MMSQKFAHDKTDISHQKRPARPLSRLLPAALVIVALSGCAPVINPLTVVSLVFDGISYATTGKGPADHVISGVTDRDCAMYRTLFDEPVCEPNDAEVKNIEKAEVPETFKDAMQAPPIYLD